MDKAVRHMHGFQDLLDHQLNQDSISEKMYGMLQEFSDDLLEAWES
ncbi:hypothetical protein GCM10028868_03040 [Virgibacillus kimchii]